MSDATTPPNATSASPLAGTALAALEAIINRFLTLDPEASARLAPLAGRVIALEFRGFGNRLYFIPDNTSLQIFAAYDAVPDCVLRGSPLALAAMGMRRHTEEVIFDRQVEIQGDTGIAHRFGQALADLEIDWEEQLSRLTGDPLAHAIGQGLGAAARWGDRSVDTLGEDLKEWLQEEARLLPTRYELGSFLTEVDRLRDDGERLAARVERLRRRLQSSLDAT